MLPKIGSYQFHIESYMCDFTGRAPLPLLGSYLLHAASGHAHERGFGYDHISRENVAWVLSRMAIELHTYPRRNQNLAVETWVESVGRFMTHRCFRFIGPEGKPIGYARTVWVALNMQTRRPVNIPAWRPELEGYSGEDVPCPIAPPVKIPACPETEPVRNYVVGYSDIDINRHLNSVKYIEHLLNVFDLDEFEGRVIRRFEIAYLAEGMCGQKLQLYKHPESADSCLVETRRGEQVLCRSRMVWRA